MIELYLIRHGVAAERGSDYPDDSKRPLTEHGIVQLRKQAKGLIQIGVSFDQILTSPLVRTRQTAETIASVFSGRVPLANLDSLAPGGSPAAVVAELAKHGRRSRLALVGHEPGIGELAARLIGARVPLEFKKGAVCRIDVDALPPTGRGQLRWFATPKMLRKLAR